MKVGQIIIQFNQMISLKNFLEIIKNTKKVTPLKTKIRRFIIKLKKLKKLI